MKLKAVFATLCSAALVAACDTDPPAEEVLEQSEETLEEMPDPMPVPVPVPVPVDTMGGDTMTGDTMTPP